MSDERRSFPTARIVATVAAALAVGLSLSPALAQRETPPSKSGNAVKSQPVAPEQVPTAPLPGAATPKPSAGGKSLGPATAPVGGSTHAKGVVDNAAYEAFDQGKYLTALELAQKAAEKGDPQAHTLIGRLYAEGFGVPKDIGLAARWYAKAGELGDHEGSFALGVLHAQGTGVEKSFDRAAQLFELAAAKGHALANYNLALLFLKGSGKPLNPHRAFGHMRYAAEQGVVPAQYDLGTLYASGTGTEANAFEAARWISRAAAQGHTDAQVDYAVMLFRDHDIFVDHEITSEDRARVAGLRPEETTRMHREGFRLLLAAAEKGSAVAQNRLARCFAKGLGVEQSLAEAAKWHLVAKAGGIEDQMLEGIVAKLPRGDRAKAQAAADDWRERALIR